MANQQVQVFMTADGQAQMTEHFILLTENAHKEPQ